MDLWSLKQKWEIVLISTLLISSTTFAQARKSPTSKEVSAWSIVATAGHSQSLYNYQDGTLRESNDFELIPGYKWGKVNSAAYIAYSQDPKRAEASGISDLVLINSMAGWEFSRVILVPGFNLIFPASKESSQNRSLQTGLSAKITAVIPQERLAKGVSLSGALSATRNIHRYDTAADGSVNSQYSSRQSILGGFSYHKISFNAEFHHVNSWSYGGKPREFFEHAEEVSLNIYKHFKGIVGHTNAGSIFRPNGYESNVRLIDENSSLIYAKIALSY